MNSSHKPDYEFEKRVAARLLDVFIRTGLLIALVMLCYRVFSPFLPLMLWALVLAVALYPIHKALANKAGGRQGLVATLLVMLGIMFIVVPTSLLVNSFGDSIQDLIHKIHNNTLQVPAPSQSVAQWPLVGEKVYAAWSQAYTNLPGLLQSVQPKMADLSRQALGVVAGLGGGLLQLVFSFIVAGIIMAFGEAGTRASLAISNRVAGMARGGELLNLTTATIRSVAAGVIGVACIQALLLGLCLIVAGVPFAGVLSLVVLIMGIAQLPAAIVTLPVIAYLLMAAHYSTTAAVGYSVLLLVAGSADNILKPLLLGRGVDAPMPVILLGALGGMATTGILGMFLGAILLAIGYHIFMRWVDENPETEQE